MWYIILFLISYFIIHALIAKNKELRDENDSLRFQNISSFGTYQEREYYSFEDSFNMPSDGFKNFIRENNKYY